MHKAGYVLSQADGVNEEQAELTLWDSGQQAQDERLHPLDGLVLGCSGCFDEEIAPADDGEQSRGGQGATNAWPPAAIQFSPIAINDCYRDTNVKYGVKVYYLAWHH